MKLIDKLPSFYNNDITRKIQEAYDIELETLRETYDDTFDQFLLIQQHGDLIIGKIFYLLKIDLI